MQSRFVFLDIAKFADLNDVSRTQGMRHMIHIYFVSYLGKL